MGNGHRGSRFDAVRSAFAQTVGRWADSRELTLVASVVCTVYEAVLLTRYVSFLPDGRDPASVWLLLGCVAAILVCVFLRRRFPLGSSLVACVCATACAHVDEGTYTGVPLLVLLYGAVARAGGGRAATVALAVTAAFWAPPYCMGQKALALVHFELALVVAAAALVSRALWTRRRAAHKLAEERTAREQATRERDEAETRSRIAGELHDSVGHDLTAIIALSEGLMGATGDRILDEAVAGINRLARDGLADTRRAVRQLSALHGRNGVTAAACCHSWDDVRAVLDHARSAGLTVAFTETGARPQDVRQAGLVFSITREAVTNVLRHAHDAHRITVAWDHAEDGSCTVTVRDDGGLPAAADTTGTASMTETDGSEGTGIVRLRRRVATTGGGLTVGPSPDGGWEVRARIPRLDATTESGEGSEGVEGIGETEDS